MLPVAVVVAGFDEVDVVEVVGFDVVVGDFVVVEVVSVVAGSVDGDFVEVEVGVAAVTVAASNVSSLVFPRNADCYLPIPDRHW